MAYRILYVEDLNPETKIEEFKLYGYDVEAYKPQSLEHTCNSIVEGHYDALVFDYKLTANREKMANKLFNAPTIAQTLRSMELTIPIILMSSQKVITEAFDLDYTNQDLFDFCISKENFSQDTTKYCKRIDAFINAYKIIQIHSYKLQPILNVSPSLFKMLDFRLKATFELPYIKNNVYAICRFVNYELIRSIGILIGEDVLSSRLGISKDSEDWSMLIDKLKDYKYHGILSEVYDRWWWDSIDIWWKTISPNRTLRQLSSTERVLIIKKYLGLNKLNPITPLQYAQSDMFWTICKETHYALDPNIDGFDLHIKNIYPWQEKEYVSAYGVLVSNPKILKHLSVVDKQAIKQIANNINAGNE